MTTLEFTSADPMLSSANQPYIYAGGDPVNNSDPSGMAYCPGTTGETQCPDPYPGPPAQYPLSSQFVQWVQVEEGSCSSTGNWCYVQGQCQIGYGHDANPTSPCHAPSVTDQLGNVLPVPMSQQNQFQLLMSDLGLYEQETSSAIPAALTQDQTYALTDFAYKLGIGYLTRSQTLFDYIVSGGSNPSTITSDFELYDQPASIDPGLLSRRYDESQMYLYGIYTHSPPPQSATVASESCVNLQGVYVT